MDVNPVAGKTYVDIDGKAWEWVFGKYVNGPGSWRSGKETRSPKEVLFMNPPWANCDIVGVRYLAQP